VDNEYLLSDYPYAVLRMWTRAKWQSGMSVSELAAAASISRSASSKWRKILLAEAQEMAV
jgi:hypothetical protein